MELCHIALTVFPFLCGPEIVKNYRSELDISKEGTGKLGSLTFFCFHLPHHRLCLELSGTTLTTVYTFHAITMCQVLGKYSYMNYFM